MANSKRRAMSATERVPVAKGTIASDSLTSGKTNPASINGSGIAALTDEEEATKFYVPIAKVGGAKEERTITGVVLQPEVVDAQGDIMDAEVIRRSAHMFLAGYNKRTKPGLMHNDFKPKFEIVESYLAPQELTINGKSVSEGSWVMTMKVLDQSAWDQIKKGKLTGFSIGGKARVQKLTPKASA